MKKEQVIAAHRKEAELVYVDLLILILSPSEEAFAIDTSSLQ